LQPVAANHEPRIYGIDQRYNLSFLLSFILSAFYFEVNTQQEVLGAAKK
jgi:hypothetical protein